MMLACIGGTKTEIFNTTTGFLCGLCREVHVVTDPFSWAISVAVKISYSLPHVIVVRKIGSGTEMAKQTSDGDVFVPGFWIHSAWMDILGPEGSYELTKFRVGRVS